MPPVNLKKTFNGGCFVPRRLKLFFFSTFIDFLFFYDHFDESLFWPFAYTQTYSSFCDIHGSFSLIGVEHAKVLSTGFSMSRVMIHFRSSEPDHHTKRPNCQGR